ncbi:MAG: carboxypeptidase regulatory-like domain-containing protein [Gemmatimonadetes bacterium]|nr:carboxypeptidase regulatory-like domain-containing protein [Gemmatimonadota bacterium]
MSSRYLLLICAAALAVAGCERAPEQKVQVQGTVTSVGFGLPVRGADVAIEWPAALGGGSTAVKTDEDGHFVAGRTVRARSLDCKGLVITVRAPGFASAYDNSSEACPNGLLTADFKMLPIPG